jgi:hypothetical protein
MKISSGFLVRLFEQLTGLENGSTLTISKTDKELAIAVVVRAAHQLVADPSEPSDDSSNSFDGPDDGSNDGSDLSTWSSNLLQDSDPEEDKESDDETPASPVPSHLI